MTPRILLADADAFYVSVARLADPEGAGKAPFLIVGGSASGRGVVTSASYEARAFGVTSAMPTARALRLCPQATIVPVPFQLCVEKSHAIREVLGRFSPVVEAASQDEAYLDLSGTERLYKEEPLAETARRMREAVKAETQLSVSIGGGTSKLIAKMAAGVAKPPVGRPPRKGDPDGVFIVPDGGEEAFMRRFQLADIPFVGAKFSQRLGRYNLKTVDEALAAGLDNLRQWLGEREGSWLWDRIHGRDSSVVVRTEGAKSISRDETFGADIDDDDLLKGELIRMVDRAAGDLRDHEYLARTITVRLRDFDFKDRQASKTVEAPILSDRAILRVARDLLTRLRVARAVPARLIGVSLSGLVRDDTPSQLSLLEPVTPRVESEKDRAVSRVVDKLREKLGDEAIAVGRKPPHRRR